MNMPKFIFVLLLVMAAAITPSISHAVGNIHFSKFEIHPYISLQEIFSDNIYYTSTNEKRDKISVILPGVKTQFPFGMHKLEAEYYANLRRYDEFRGENTTDHRARGMLDFKFGSLFTLTLKEDFKKDHEGRGSSATGFIEIYRSNTASASAVYQLAGRSKIQVDYGRTSYNYMISAFRDRDEDVVSGFVYYRFLPKTSAFIEYDHKAIDFTLPTSSLDNAMDSALFGITWEATAKSKGTIKAGRTWKKFDSPALTDFSRWTASFDINHNFTEYTSLQLIGKRDINETNVLGTAYFITTGAYAEFSHKFVSKLAGLMRVSYGEDVFSNPVAPDITTRRDKTVMAGLGLRYSMKEWLQFGFDYNQNKRNSNINMNDYTEHHYLLSVNATF